MSSKSMLQWWYNTRVQGYLLFTMKEQYSYPLSPPPLRSVRGKPLVGDRKIA